MAAALGTRFGATTREPDGSLVIGAGPGEWLVLGAPDTGDKQLDRLRGLATETGEFTSVVDLTHGRALVRLTGARAADLLATVCAIDLADDITPDGAALRTHVAGIVTDLVRDDRDAAPSYLLHCERSSGQSLWDALLDAGTEFGIGTTKAEER
jgi:sarcosine oxidase subunit alpha